MERLKMVQIVSFYLRRGRKHGRKFLASGGVSGGEILVVGFFGGFDVVDVVHPAEDSFEVVQLILETEALTGVVNVVGAHTGQGVGDVAGAGALDGQIEYETVCDYF